MLRTLSDSPRVVHVALLGNLNIQELVLIIVIAIPLITPFLSRVLFFLAEADLILVCRAHPGGDSEFVARILPSMVPILLGRRPILRAPAGLYSIHALLIMLTAPQNPVVRCALVEQLLDVVVLLDLRLDEAELLGIIGYLCIS